MDSVRRAHCAACQRGDKNLLQKRLQAARKKTFLIGSDNQQCLTTSFRVGSAQNLKVDIIYQDPRQLLPCSENNFLIFRLIKKKRCCRNLHHGRAHAQRWFREKQEHLACNVEGNTGIRCRSHPIPGLDHVTAPPKKNLQKDSWILPSRRLVPHVVESRSDRRVVSSKRFSF